jgi:hypothetical protein
LSIRAGGRRTTRPRACFTIGSPRSYPPRLTNLWLEAGDGVTLESCLGLGSTWRSARRRQRRDRLLRQIAEHFPVRGRAQANAVIKAIADYETRAWPRDRRSGNRRLGLPSLLFELLALGAPLLSEESIRTLLGKRRLRKTHPRSDDLPQISKATHGDSE